MNVNLIIIVGSNSLTIVAKNNCNVYRISGYILTYMLVLEVVESFRSPIALFLTFYVIPKSHFLIY